MTRRTYTKTRRADTEALMRERILRATVELHARHGAVGTTYKMIADKAGVSPQTVYNHFPSLGPLIKGCTGHVQAQAPRVDASVFVHGGAAAERLTLLANAVYAQLEFMSPWLRLGWGEAEHVPELRTTFDAARAQRRELLTQAAAPEYRASPDFLDAALLLLDYPAWKGLRDHRTPPQAAALAGECLVALLAPLSQASSEDTP